MQQLTQVLFVLAVIGAIAPAHAQQYRLLPVGNSAYWLIEHLQERGHLLRLNPTALPYTQGEVRDAMSKMDPTSLSVTEKRWYQALKKQLTVSDKKQGHVVAGGRVEAGLRSTNNGRLNPLRYLDNHLPSVLPRAALHGFLETGPLILHAGAQHDLYYDRDPDGLDAARRLYVRSEPSYAGISAEWASLYVGRYSTHWGLSDAPGLLVSNNPRAYDMLTLQLGRGPLMLRSLLGELDPLGPDGAFEGRGFEDGSHQRFLAAHRLDWRPNSRLTLTLMESTLYSGPGAGLSLKYLNPLNPLYLVVANRPRHHQTNGFIAAQVWTQFRPVTISGQLLVDDFDFINGEEPVSFAFTSEAHYAPPSLPGNIGGGFTMVAARTYNTNQTEGKYWYLKRGLGTEFNDYIHTYVDAEWRLTRFPLSLTLHPQVHLLWQGEGRIGDDFGNVSNDDPIILRGTEERTIRPALGIRLAGSAHWWLRTNLGVNLIQNADHEAGMYRIHFLGVLEAGARISLKTIY